MKKITPYLILLLAIIAVVVTKFDQKSHPAHKGSHEITRTSGTTARKIDFNRNAPYLEYTEHAKCRMDCRHISPSEIKDIMKNGLINYKKSDMEATPCPTFAVEGLSSDDQRLRIVFAQCDNRTKVVTCIDLDHEWTCHCPGDDK
ncbi:MAG: DUF4258 domain-containing protein [Chitinophagales bacterium]|nr:DUF4258 domain-containing protein [Chitinophagales bacterium]